MTLLLLVGELGNQAMYTRHILLANNFANDIIMVRIFHYYGTVWRPSICKVAHDATV